MLFPLLCAHHPSPDIFGQNRVQSRFSVTINIIQSECWSPDISGVYDPIPAKFCEQVGLWTKGAEKYPNFGYLDNRCHGNQKTSPELIKHLKDYGFQIGGALDGKKIVAVTLLPWQPLGFHGNQKNVPLKVNQ